VCVNDLSKVALDSAAAGIEPAISSRKYIGHINEVNLRRAQLVLGLVIFGWSIPSQYFPDPLSLAVPLWAGAMSASGSFSHRRERRNAEFCVSVGPAGILAASGLKALAVDLSWPSNRYGLYAGLIGSNHRRS